MKTYGYCRISRKSQNIERQVVDGQQRLMTFTIAFSVLAQLFKKENENTSHRVGRKMFAKDSLDKGWLSKIY